MGKITNIFVEEGQKVVKGDILAQLDTKDHDLALEEAVNNLTRQQPLMNIWKNNIIKPKTMGRGRNFSTGV